MGSRGGLAMSNESDAQGLDDQEVDQGSTDEWPRFRIPKWWLAILLLLLLGLAGQLISETCANESFVNECFP
jgi:hypothetical protein